MTSPSNLFVGQQQPSAAIQQLQDVEQQSEQQIIEGCVGALQVLARDNINRDLIRSMGAIPIGVQLLYSEDEGVQRAATSLLCELACDKEGAAKIEQEGATSPLTSLLNSKNDAISAYAAAILFKMSEGKSQDYKNQLNSELTNSLYRDELHHWPPIEGVGSTGDMDMGMLVPEEIYQSHIYGQTQPSLMDNSNIYQGIYESRQTMQAMSPVHGHGIYGTTINSTLPIDQTNDYSTYGQVTGMHPIQPQNSTNMTGSQAWYDSDL